MMDNYLMIEKDKNTAELSSRFDFANTYFIEEDFVLITAKSKGDLLAKLKRSRKKVIFHAASGELLRFAVEKTSVSIILGMETINVRDSLHFLRSGLDNIVCKIAAERGKIFAFSFSSLLNSSERPKLMARMAFNIQLCRKYHVETLFSNFSYDVSEMRGVNELKSFWNVLCKKKIY